MDVHLQLRLVLWKIQAEGTVLRMTDLVEVMYMDTGFGAVEGVLIRNKESLFN